METLRMKVHAVTWNSPLGPEISPYLNRAGIVRRLAYARLRAALDFARADAEARVLDFGCWDGHFLPSLLANFREVWGVDDDSGSLVETLPGVSSILQVARKLCESETGAAPRLGLVQASGEGLPFSTGYFDIVFCLDTLAHIAPPTRRRVVAELSRVTRAGGQLIVSLPIEVGPVLLLRQMMRALTRKSRDVYSAGDMLRSVAFRPRYTSLSAGAITGKGYDFRRDLELLQSSFTIRRKQFVPANVLGPLNSCVVVDCQSSRSH